MAVTADGQRAVSASDDKRKVWDVETGRALLTLDGHSGSILGVAMTADGRRAISASEDKTLKVWDLEAGLPSATLRCDESASCCAFACDQKIVAGDNIGHLHFFQIEERQ